MFDRCSYVLLRFDSGTAHKSSTSLARFALRREGGLCPIRGNELPRCSLAFGARRPAATATWWSISCSRRRLSYRVSLRLPYQQRVTPVELLPPCAALARFFQREKPSDLTSGALIVLGGGVCFPWMIATVALPAACCIPPPTPAFRLVCDAVHECPACRCTARSK